jgi:hypothetical protein
MISLSIGVTCYHGDHIKKEEKSAVYGEQLTHHQLDKQKYKYDRDHHHAAT